MVNTIFFHDADRPGGHVERAREHLMGAERTGTFAKRSNGSWTASMLGINFDIEFKRGNTLDLAAQARRAPDGWLVLNGNMKGIANHLAVMPNSPAGAVVLSMTILSEPAETHEQLAEIVKSGARLWFPDHDVEKCGYPCRNAQIAEKPGFQSKRPGYDSGTPRLYFGGEFTTNGSIDGAIQSGLECAEFLASRLGASVA